MERGELYQAKTLGGKPSEGGCLTRRVVGADKACALDFRSVCQRCLRPEVVCYCGRLAALETTTRVLILQHPRERRVPVSTARMAHLSLPNSELHYGVTFEDNARVTDLCKEPGTYVLFPAEDSKTPEQLREAPPRNVIVVDGTWSLAKKVIKSNPALLSLPKIAFTPRRPSNYRIRKEPADHCVSTIEAVCELLGGLEGDHDRFDRMLNAFEYMVDRQLEYARTRTGPVRYKVHKAPPRPRVPPQFRDAFHRMVAVYAEANAHPRGAGYEDKGELVHLVASRPATGQRFEAVIRPRRPLAESTPFHLKVSAAMLEEGEELSTALARFRAFVRSDDTLCAWGGFPFSMLTAEGFSCGDAQDVRVPVMRYLRGRPGSVEAAAEKLNVAPAILGQGRAGVRLGALHSVMLALNAAASAPVPALRLAASQ